MKTFFIGHSLSALLPNRRRRSLTGRVQSGTEDSGGRGGRLTTIMGTVEEGGDKLRFVSEQRAWKVNNPEILEGHEGHYVHAKVYVYPDKDLIHITEVKIPTARETMENDIK
jgi:hypothetical protein